LISSLDDLRIVELDRLILHEAHDDGRLSRLRERMRAEGVQRNPVLASPYEDRYLVLDGAHRVHSLKELGCRLILVQLTEPPERAESWGHLLNGAVIPDLRGVGEVEMHAEEPGSWLAAVETAGGESSFVRAREETLAGEVRALWALQEVYPDGGVVHRVDPGSPVALSEGEALVRYRPFAPAELVEVVASGAVLPPGITRFHVRERVLGVRFPLRRMQSADPEAANAELKRHIREFWDQNRIRYYGEPVVLFE
jgi:hypothetical protein